MFFFLPDYTYLAHAYHHRVATFSTLEDPEYVPVAHQRLFELLLPFVIFPFIPLVLAFRMLVLGPISLLVGGSFRKKVLEHASTLKMNARYVWKTMTPEDERLSAKEDIATVIWWALFLMGCYGVWGFGVLREVYVISYLVLTINHFRSLARHRYTNAQGTRVSYDEQIMDSVTVVGFSPLAMLLMPVGLRYHSIHHMYPSLPYHNLKAAHRRLMQSLPKDHVYFKTIEPSFSSAILNLFRKRLA